MNAGQGQETGVQGAPRAVRHVEERGPRGEADIKAYMAWIQARLGLKLPKLGKDTQGHGYKYASLSSILGSIEGPLRAAGFIIRWTTWSPSSETLCVRCSLVHVGGWIERSELCGVPERLIGGRMSGMQQRGAFLTYAQRYTLLAVLGTTADVDTDGAAGPKIDQHNAVPQQGNPYNQEDPHGF